MKECWEDELHLHLHEEVFRLLTALRIRNVRSAEHRDRPPFRIPEVFTILLLRYLRQAKKKRALRVNEMMIIQGNPPIFIKNNSNNNINKNNMIFL